LTVTSESGFAAGDTVLVYDVSYKYGTTGRNQEINRVDSTAANTITLENRIIEDYTTANTAAVVKLSAIENAGVQNGKLAITGSDDGGNISMLLSYNCFVRNCLITGCDDDAGIKTEQSAIIDIYNNTIRDGQNQSTGGFAYAVSIGESSHGVNIHDNHVENVRECVFTNNARHCKFIGNDVYSCYSGSANTHGDGNENIIIANNNVYSSRGASITVGNDSDNAPDKNISVIGNHIYDSGGSGISVSANTDKAKDNVGIKVSGNQVMRFGIRASSSYGILCARTDDAEITDNLIDGAGEANAGHGVFIQDANRIDVKSNRIRNIVRGIELSTDSVDTHISDNRIYNASSHEIREASTGHSGIVIENNRSDGTTLSFLSTPRRNGNIWGTKYDENYGAASSTADGGTITHNCVGTPTLVTVSGSVASEMVSVTAIGATTFTVAIKKDDGTAGTSQTVYWRCHV
jgi:nitrous oxidase accessory protein NosD